MASGTNEIASAIVADDNAGYRSILCELLRQMPGIRVVGECPDSATAVRLCARHRPDLLLLDAGMKDSDPLTAAAAVRRASPQTIIVFLTTGVAGQLRAADYHHMADHVISKSDVKAALGPVLSGWREGNNSGET